VVKTIKLLNKSKVNLEVEVEEKNKGELNDNFLTVTPTSSVLKPRGVLPIDVKFNPLSRVPRFVCDLNIKVQG